MVQLRDVDPRDVLAPAFGVLIVLLLIVGSLWIMSNLNHNMMPDSLTFEAGSPYRVMFRNTGTGAHNFSSSEFFSAVLLRPDAPGTLASRTGQSPWSTSRNPGAGSLAVPSLRECASTICGTPMLRWPPRAGSACS